jgi:hypothetical protein
MFAAALSLALAGLSGASATAARNAVLNSATQQHVQLARGGCGSGYCRYRVCDARSCRYLCRHCNGQ